MWVTKQLTVPIDFHSMENKQYGDHQLFGHTQSCVQQKKEIHRGLEQLEGE